MEENFQVTPFYTVEEAENILTVPSAEEYNIEYSFISIIPRFIMF